MMGKTIKLLLSNLQHAKAASYTISRRFSNELLVLSLIQGPWTTGPGRINILVSGKPRKRVPSSSARSRAIVGDQPAAIQPKPTDRTQPGLDER
ncbi:hypothetical protein JTB14_029325 [Gonioctena quinquepunctata]|nr:hypothetical protein JTB14_029325 [Gonioctena quinquepunctata]